MRVQDANSTLLLLGEFYWHSSAYSLALTATHVPSAQELCQELSEKSNLLLSVQPRQEMKNSVLSCAVLPGTQCHTQQSSALSALLSHSKPLLQVQVLHYLGKR